MPPKRKSSIKSVSSSNSLADLFGSGMNSISLGVSTIGAGVSTGVNSIGNVTINTISTIGTVAQNPYSQHQESKKDISTELCMSEFKNFLCYTLAMEVQNSDVLNPLYDCLEADTLLQEELNDMELGLKSVLKSNPTLPSKVVSQVHTFLGMVSLELNNNAAAVDAFMRAIWFISRNPEDKLAIAHANHRLGLAYGRKKDYEQALDLIDRAISGYEPSSNDYLTAKEDRHEVMEAQQLDLLAKAGRVPKAVADAKTKHRRACRRQQRKDRPQRQRSFNKGLADALKIMKPSQGVPRQSSTPSLLRSDSEESLVSGQASFKRQSTSPMP